MASEKPPAGGENSSADLERLLSQANLHRLRRQWTDAVNLCASILKSDPDNVTAHALLGDIYRDQDQPEEAIRWYRMAFDLKPGEALSARIADERKRLAASKETLTRQLQRSGPGALNDEVGGTRRVGPLPPQIWLRAITGVSLLFLVVMVIGLLWIQAERKKESPIARPDPRYLQPAPATQAEQPSQQPAPQQKSDVIGGGGLPPDKAPVQVRP
ncbi:MAG TPA: tetratricopeptide repeat protein [Chthonomonadales bacterium]|nr:tetratricopeptide repeat protein [Chthonomonadales bacterium]